MLKESADFSVVTGKAGRRMGAAQNEFIPTRDTLLARLKSWQDQQSWKEFFDIYWRLIYNTARRAGLSEAEAQDVVQETVISVCKNIPEFEYDPKRGSFKGWLMKLTGWRIADHLRKRRPQEVALDADGAEAIEELRDPAAFDPEKHWDGEWEKNLLAVALDRVKARVDARKYQLFELYALEQLPVEQVAELMRVSTGTIYLTKHRLTLLLKLELRRLKRQTSEPPPRSRNLGKGSTC